jgi:hypothetical protein
MKKILLTIAAALSLGATANAQLALENFNAGVLPAGWVLINDGHTVSTSFTGVTWLQDSLNNNAWFPVQAYSAGDYQMITTSKFTPTASADRWLITPAFNVTSANMVIQWDDDDLSSGESIEVLVSPTADTTKASFTASIYSAPASPSGLATHQVVIGGYNGTSIRVAFRDKTANNWGELVDNVQTAVLPALDLGVTSLNLPPFVQTNSSNTITGILHNYGITTVTSLNLNYNVNGGAPVVSPASSISVALGADYTYTSTTPWVPATSGTYKIKVWADNINSGGVDGNHANDTFVASILVIDTLQPKQVMVEEFTQASCDPCANAHVNVDTVYTNNLSRANLVRYHVNFPGRDCMDSVTLNPFVNARITYYNVNGVPDAQVDGYYVYPGAAGPGTFSSDVIAQAAAVGSPFNISITPYYNATTTTYSVTATIKSHGPVPAGLKCYAVLVVDTITYAANQSTETIAQTVFPQVAENMFPSSAGTALSAFTSGSTQTLHSSWVKNHRWGSNFSVWAYDSSATSTVIVWVEDDATQYVYQSARATVLPAPNSVSAVTGTAGSMDIYPNPASKTATVSLTLTQAADVRMEVYNVTGQMVYSMPNDTRNAGVSVSTIDLSNFASGNYFVRVYVGNDVLNKKFTVTK